MFLNIRIEIRVQRKLQHKENYLPRYILHIINGCNKKLIAISLL